MAVRHPAVQPPGGAWLTKAGHRTRINYAPGTYNVFPTGEEKEKEIIP